MSVGTLRRAIDEARPEFWSALDAVTPVWNQPPAGPAGAVWAPRQVAEHVLGAELDHTAEVSRTILSHVREEDLERRVPSGATVREVMQKAASHLNEHARQLRRITAHPI
jgi:hypothetical protein